MSKSNDLQGNVLNAIAGEIVDERIAQLDKWGVQSHPSYHSANAVRQMAVLADRWKQINDARVQDGSTAWDGILLEEVYEALAEIDPLLRRAELIQVAAVAAAEVEAIDRAIEAGVYDDVPVVDSDDSEDDEDAA